MSGWGGLLTIYGELIFHWIDTVSGGRITRFNFLRFSRRFEQIVRLYRSSRFVDTESTVDKVRSYCRRMKKKKKKELKIIIFIENV